MGLFSFLTGQPSFAEGVAKADQTPGSILLDVRTAEEYAQGHLPGSVLCPLAQMGQFQAKKDTPIFVYCASGIRSAQAAAFLKQQGYEQVTNIGGIGSWSGPVEQGEGK